MAKKRTVKKKTSKKKAAKRAAKKKPVSTSSPKLPYTVTPNALRKFLKFVPEKPKPEKVNNELLSAWELGGNNANSIIRVLKAIGLVSSANDPTEDYELFMHRQGGPQHLANLVRVTYRPLFNASHNPHQESDDSLKNLFNIHSGGSEATLQHQIATFKTLCEFADFSSAIPEGAVESSAAVLSDTGAAQAGSSGIGNSGGATIHIDLHIHLPENKSARDYQAIFEDIGRYIYGHVGSADE